VVRSQATGKITGIVPVPKSANAEVDDLVASTRSGTFFVMAAAPDTLGQRLYRFRLTSTGRVTGFASGELVAQRAPNGNDLWTQALSQSNRNNALSEIRDIAGRPVIYRGDVLAAHEAAEPYGTTPRSFVVQGDMLETVPRYLEENPETVVALAYFDCDLYEPTRAAFQAIRPYLTTGSIVAFDELAHPKWPGETSAIRELIGLDHGRLRQIPGREPPVIYMEWEK